MACARFCRRSDSPTRRNVVSKRWGSSVAHLIRSVPGSSLAAPLYIGAGLRQGDALPQTGTPGAKFVPQNRKRGPIGFAADHPAYQDHLQRACFVQPDGPVYGYLQNAPDRDRFLDRNADAGTAHIERQTASSGLALPGINVPVLNPLMNWKSVGLALFLKLRTADSSRLYFADRAVDIARHSAGKDECATHRSSRPHWWNYVSKTL